jgi:hypothetical protein
VTYESILRKKFQGIELEIEDLYLLESFQIGYLPDRVPQREFAAVLHANAAIKRFLITKHPSIADFVRDILTRYGPAASQQELDAFSDRLEDKILEASVTYVQSECPKEFIEQEANQYEQKFTAWPLFVNSSGHISLDPGPNSLSAGSSWGHRWRGRGVRGIPAHDARSGAGSAGQAGGYLQSPLPLRQSVAGNE